MMMIRRWLVFRALIVIVIFDDIVIVCCGDDEVVFKVGMPVESVLHVRAPCLLFSPSTGDEDNSLFIVQLSGDLEAFGLVVASCCECSMEGVEGASGHEATSVDPVDAHDRKSL